MASTNKTTNYELSQFIETDRPAWLTDYNGDMRTIDRIMKAISDMASGASGSVSELADRMSTAEGNISTNTNDIATLDARADALEAGAQSQAGTIANIQTEQTAQNLGIEAATELGYNLARPYDSASTYSVGDYVLFQNTLYKCITAVPVGEAFMPAKWLAIKAMDEMNTGGYTLPIASASQLGGVKVGNGLSIDPESGVLSANGGSTSRFIILDNANTSFTTGRIIAYKHANYYTQTTSSTDVSLSNVSIQIRSDSSAVDRASYFYTDGKIAILQLYLNMAFSLISLSAFDHLMINTRITISNNDIYLPTTNMFAISSYNGTQENLITMNKMEFYKSDSVFDWVFNRYFRSNSEINQTQMLVQFVYPVQTS